MIDLHFHIGPEFVRRKENVISLAKSLSEKNVGAVIKNHCFSTTPLASLARSLYDIDIYGSVTLNYYVGGMNRYAILGAISGNKQEVMGNEVDNTRFVVWMPTVHAAAHISHIGWDFDPAWGVDERYCRKGLRGINILDSVGKLSRQTYEVLEVVKESDLVLATGHLSGEETIKVVEEARRMGIERIILTHPFYKPTNLSIPSQKYLAGLGAFVEHTYGVHLIDNISIEKYVESINQVGAKRTVISTDLGQANNPSLIEGFNLFIGKLRGAGIDEEDIGLMSHDNPSLLLK